MRKHLVTGVTAHCHQELHKWPRSAIVFLSVILLYYS